MKKIGILIVILAVVAGAFFLGRTEIDSSKKKVSTEKKVAQEVLEVKEEPIEEKPIEEEAVEEEQVEVEASAEAVEASPVEVPAVEEEVSPNPELVSFLDKYRDKIPKNVTVSVVGNGFVGSFIAPAKVSDDDIRAAESLVSDEINGLLAKVQSKAPQCEYLEIRILNANGDIVLSARAS